MMYSSSTGYLVLLENWITKVMPSIFGSDWGGGETGSYYAARARLEFTILLPQHPKCWEYRQESQHTRKIIYSFGFFSFLGSTGIWTQDRVHSRQELYKLSHSANLFLHFAFTMHLVLSNVFVWFFVVVVEIRVWTQGFTFAKKVLYCLSHTSSLLCSDYFGDGASQTICPGWFLTVILQFPAFQVATIYSCEPLGPCSRQCFKIIKMYSL
jgi:hypothetical protein